MLKTLQIKLLPTCDQKDILLGTFKKFNEACNFVSKIAGIIKYIIKYPSRNWYIMISETNSDYQHS